MIRLEDLCSISTGSTDTKDAVVDGAYPLFDRSKIIKKSTKYLFDCAALIIPGEGAEFLPKYYSGKFDLHQRAYALFNMKSELDIQFLKYYLIFVKDYFTRVAVGATVKSLRRRHFADLEIPLPPLPEQKTIVEKLDAAFAEIDLLEANLATKAARTSALLNSILGAAFTPDSAAGLEPHQGPAMKTVKLGAVAEVIAGQSPEGIFYNAGNIGMPFYQGKKEFGAKFLGKPTTWTTKVTKTAISGDILMSVRAPVGPINFATTELCIGRGLAAIRAGEKLNNDFLFYFLLFQQPNLVGNAGAVFDSINKDQIASIDLPLPSLPEQKAIVEKLDAAFAEIDLMRDQAMAAKSSFSALRQSILSSAFTEVADVA